MNIIALELEFLVEPLKVTSHVVFAGKPVSLKITDEPLVYEFAGKTPLSMLNETKKIIMDDNSEAITIMKL